MNYKYQKLLTYFFGTILLVSVGFVLPTPPSFPPTRGEKRPLSLSQPGPAVKAASNSLLTETALTARNTRLSRSPAFVPGTRSDVKTKAALERYLNDPTLAAHDEALKEFFPESSEVNQWIRASIVLSGHGSANVATPELMETTESVYAAILGAEESAVQSLTAGLQAIPRNESTLRQQSFRMLSDLGLKNAGLREAVKTALLGETARAGSHSDGALAIAALLRVNPSKEWFQEVNRAYGKLNPGAELTDLVSLKVVSL